ncbi:hypothetical protein EYC80_003085 [Monilinia laxa]|uniref:Cofilin n=1 Tax=Monilinia laxa TaxID=61186 RepID=A0A5N6KDW5_MONLA|nr:hypothetical protein EYC80_003085 [Monilinia laxa]
MSNSGSVHPHYSPPYPEHELTSHYSITVDDECIEKFNEMKLQKKIKWIVYKINDEGTKVVVDTSSESADWEPFREVLVNAKALNKNKTQGKGPRYAVYDFNYDLANGEGQRTKLTFISWSPDDATTFPKMMYASTKESFKRALSGLSGDELQANDEADLEENEIYDSHGFGNEHGRKKRCFNGCLLPTMKCMGCEFYSSEEGLIISA